AAVTDRDVQIAKLIGRGYTRGEVASRLKVSTKTVSRVMGRPDARALAQRTRELGDPDAVAVLRELLTSPNDHVRLRAAIALLREPVAPDAAIEDDRPRIQVFARG